MHFLRRAAGLMFVAVVGTACSAATSGSESTSRSSRNELTRQEILDASASNVLEAVQRLRPTWLRVRGSSSARGSAPIIVMLDGVRVGEVDFLERMQPDNVLRVRYVSASDATTRWGTGFTSGAIEVITR